MKVALFIVNNSCSNNERCRIINKLHGATILKELCYALLNISFFTTSIYSRRWGQPAIEHWGLKNEVRLYSFYWPRKYESFGKKSSPRRLQGLGIVVWLCILLNSWITHANSSCMQKRFLLFLPISWFLSASKMYGITVKQHAHHVW